jgi:CP family cyanate transporter-like MFS transporter
LSALNLGQLPASLVTFLLAQRLSLGKGAYVALPVLSLLGIGALLRESALIVVAASGLIGFCCAFTLILSLALPPQIAPPGDVHRLSAGMFAIGYSLSFLIPLLGGAIWDAAATPKAAFAGSGLAALIALGAGLSRRPLRPRRLNAA